MRIHATIEFHFTESASTESTESFDDFLAKLESLDEHGLTAVAAILEAEDMSGDLLRRFLRQVPGLMNPGKALRTAYDLSRAEFLELAYRLATLRDFFSGQLPEPESFRRFVVNLFQEPSNCNGSCRDGDDSGVVASTVHDNDTPKLKN